MRHLFWSWPALILLFVACQTQQSIKPIRPTATPGSSVVSGQPVLVTFTELESEPFRYLDHVVRVSGDYMRLPPPACRYERGPRVRWALVAEGFRMDAIGLEPILRLAPAELTLTVDGIWRRYEGRLGCGKGPPPGIAWYLEAQRIVHPNPLPQFDVASPPPPAVPGPPQPPITAEPTLSAVTGTPTGSPPAPVLTGTPSATPIRPAVPSPGAATVTMTPGASPTYTLTATATATVITTPATATPPALPSTPTPTPEVPGYPAPPPPPPIVTPPTPYP